MMVKKPGAFVRWIDGMQNIADVLTKAGADKTLLHEFMKTGKLCLVQTDQNRALKEQKQRERQKRKVKKDESSSKQALRDVRKKHVIAEMAEKISSSGSDLGSKEKQ